MADFTTGQILDADDLNAAFPIVKFKASDESVTSSTTLQNDNDLFATVAANRTYIFEAFLNFTGDADGDAKFAFTFPSGARLDYGFAVVDASLVVTLAGVSNATSGQSITIGVAGTSTLRPSQIRGTLQVGATAGTFQLQWAQNSSIATATVLREGSHLVLTRVPA